MIGKLMNIVKELNGCVKNCGKLSEKPKKIRIREKENMMEVKETEESVIPKIDRKKLRQDIKCLEKVLIYHKRKIRDPELNAALQPRKRYFCYNSSMKWAVSDDPKADDLYNQYWESYHAREGYKADLTKLYALMALSRGKIHLSPSSEEYDYTDNFESIRNWLSGLINTYKMR